MPCVEVSISGLKLTEEITVSLEKGITKALQDSISLAFPAELNLVDGTDAFEKGHEIAKNIMPGWTWVSIYERRWAVRGTPMVDKIAVRIHILVLQSALYQVFKQKAISAVTKVVKEILGNKGKELYLFVDMIEGEVEMTLPNDLFGNFTKGESEKMLQPPEITQYMMKEILDKLS